jgi:copper chaperone
MRELDIYMMFSSWSDYLRLAMQTVVLKVAMSCEGCAGAVRRVLTKMEG